MDKTLYVRSQEMPKFHQIYCGVRLENLDCPLYLLVPFSHDASKQRLRHMLDRSQKMVVFNMAKSQLKRIIKTGYWNEQRFT